MTIQRVIASLNNIGAGSSKEVDPFLPLSGFILTIKGFQLADMEAAAVKANWEAGIKANTVIPVLGDQFWDYEDQSVEETIAESGLQKRAVMRQGDYRYLFMLRLTLYVQKQMQSFRNQDLRIFLVDEAGNVYGTLDGSAFKGFSTSLVNPGKKMFVASGADAPSISNFLVDLNDYKEWNVNGQYLPNPSFNIETLAPLTTVTLEESGSSTDSSVTVNVYTSPGVSADGTVYKEGVKGLLEADFDISDVGVATGFTDNGDGTYTFTSTAAFSSGSINLVAPASITAEFDGLYIESAGALAITIT